MDYAKVYGELHESGAQKHFAGYTMKRYRDSIVEMVKASRPRLLLDYGSGKGYQYVDRAYHAAWAPFMAEGDKRAGVPVCYDVGVRQLRQRACAGKKDCVEWCPFVHPKSKEACAKTPIFDGVFSTDMLEHIERKDLPRILSDMLGFLTWDDRPTFAFFSVSCIPADKFFPDGRNVHVTMEPPDWWMPLLDKSYLCAPGPQLRMRVMFETADAMVTRDWKR